LKEEDDGLLRDEGDGDRGKGKGDDDGEDDDDGDWADNGKEEVGEKKEGEGRVAYKEEMLIEVKEGGACDRNLEDKTISKDGGSMDNLREPKGDWECMTETGKVIF
jgi:hypothetical protein